MWLNHPMECTLIISWKCSGTPHRNASEPPAQIHPALLCSKSIDTKSHLIPTYGTDYSRNENFML